MKVCSLYDPATGHFTGEIVGGSPKQLAANMPPGLLAIEGRFDRLSQRVDLETGTVVDWQPPAPDGDHEWNPDSKRWVLKIEIAAAIERSRAALAEIEKLEGSQARPLRELAIDPSAESAAAKLRAIDEEIAALRRDLSD